MKTVYNTDTEDRGVYVADRQVYIAGGCSKSLEDDIADAVVEQAKKDGIKFTLTAPPAVLSPEHASTLEKAQAVLAHGPVMPIALLNERSLLALDASVLLEIAKCADCTPLLTMQTAKTTIVDEILNGLTMSQAAAARPTTPTAGTTSGKSGGAEPSKAGSIPAPATPPSTGGQDLPAAGGQAFAKPSPGSSPVTKDVNKP